MDYEIVPVLGGSLKIRKVRKEEKGDNSAEYFVLLESFTKLLESDMPELLAALSYCYACMEEQSDASKLLQEMLHQDTPEIPYKVCEACLFYLAFMLKQPKALSIVRQSHETILRLSLARHFKVTTTQICFT